MTVAIASDVEAPLVKPKTFGCRGPTSNLSLFNTIFSIILAIHERSAIGLYSPGVDLGIGTIGKVKNWDGSNECSHVKFANSNRDCLKPSPRCFIKGYPILSFHVVDLLFVSAALTHSCSWKGESDPCFLVPMASLIVLSL